jgi:L-amino acid N-acyltransferase YncA
MSDAVQIRPAAETDLPQMLAIYGHHVLHGLASFEEQPPGLEEYTGRWKSVCDKGLPWVVAVDPDHTVLGYAYAGPYRARPAYRHSVENSVYVAPHAARRGLGKSLLLRVIEDCEKLGWVRQMIGIIGDSDNAASIGLHLHLGFEMVGTLKSVGFKHGRWVDTVITQRTIGSGDSLLPDQDN